METFSLFSKVSRNFLFLHVLHSILALCSFIVCTDQVREFKFVSSPINCTLVINLRFRFVLVKNAVEG